VSAFPPRSSVPAPYVAGTITVAAGKTYGLLELIHQQLFLDVPGTSVEFRIEADATNAAPIFVGATSPGGGPISCDNYAYALTPMGPSRKYRASYPGTGTPQGVLQVFAPAGGKLHVEVNE
jgi:hypothetical protein